MLAIVVWLLEQGVVVAPVLGVALYLTWPKSRRPTWLNVVTGALAVLFIVNLVGVYPGPARVVSCSFDAGLPVCEKTSARGPAETSRADTRTVAHSGSAGVEVETPAPDGGSLSAGAALQASSRARQSLPGSAMTQAHELGAGPHLSAVVETSRPNHAACGVQGTTTARLDTPRRARDGSPQAVAPAGAYRAEAPA